MHTWGSLVFYSLSVSTWPAVCLAVVRHERSKWRALLEGSEVGVALLHRTCTRRPTSPQSHHNSSPPPHLRLLVGDGSHNKGHRHAALAAAAAHRRRRRSDGHGGGAVRGAGLRDEPLQHRRRVDAVCWRWAGVGRKGQRRRVSERGRAVSRRAAHMLAHRQAGRQAAFRRVNSTSR